MPNVYRTSQQVLHNSHTYVYPFPAEDNWRNDYPDEDDYHSDTPYSSESEGGRNYSSLSYRHWEARYQPGMYFTVAYCFMLPLPLPSLSFSLLCFLAITTRLTVHVIRGYRN